jgi:hypothetical protein
MDSIRHKYDSRVSATQEALIAEDGLEDMVLGGGIKAAENIFDNNDTVTEVYRAGESDTLLLATGQKHAFATDDDERLDRLDRLDRLGHHRGHHGKWGWCGIAETDPANVQMLLAGGS